MASIEQLAALIDELSDRPGTATTAIPGLYLSKLYSNTVPRSSVEGAVFCLVAQGAKRIILHDQRYLYDPGKYFIASVNLPLVAQTIEAAPHHPCLGLTITLDFAEISALMLEAQLPMPAHSQDVQSLGVAPLEDALLNAVVRLTSLLKTPAQIPILAPLVRREFFYHLLLSEYGAVLRQLTAANSHVSRIAAGVRWLKNNIAQPVSMDELARVTDMSPSTMYAWFKAVTHMSPLQFQKQLRLMEARRLLLAETADVMVVSRRVGYVSPSQFNREYRRMFGLPPLQDMQRVRAFANDSSAPFRRIGARADQAKTP